MYAWYLLYCKPRNEERAQQNLALQNIETYLPMCFEKKKTKVETQVKRLPLFPNYIFARFDPTITSLSTVRSTRGVSQVVNASERMLPLDNLVDAIRQQEAALGIIDVNEKPQKQTEPEYQQGDKVKLVEGPFQQLEAVFEQPNGKERCFVLLNILGRMQTMSVPKSALIPAG